MIFWGHLSVWNTRLWPFEVVFLCGIVGYDLCKVICLCGIPDYDLLRSFVCVEYQIVTFWGRISVWDSGLWPLWGYLSLWNSWFISVTFWGCLSVDCDLLRSFVHVEYRIMIFWGCLSMWNTGLWSFEVICPCGIPDCDLLRSYFCVEYRIMIVCPCGIPDCDLLRSYFCVA